MSQPAQALEPSKSYRWLVLFWLSLTMFGNYYFYDALEPLADLLQKQLHYTDQNIGLLNSFYSIAPIMTVFLGGLLIDRLGVRRALLTFGCICLAGSMLTAASPSFAIMASGRFVFGMGAESLIVALTAAVAKWFKGKELSFALGMQLMLARFGSWLAQNSASWAHPAYETWRGPWLVGVAFVTLCVIGPIAYWIMEARAESRFSLGRAGEADKIVAADVWDLLTNRSFLLLVGLCVIFYSAIFPFETFAVKYFMDAHGTTRAMGGFLLSVLTAFTMFGTPIVGLFSDKVGRRATIMCLGVLLLLPVFLMMGYTHVSLYVPMAILGFAFTFVPAIIWPSVAYIVPERALGTALGLMTMVQNVGMAGLNWGLGRANDAAGASAANPSGYLPMLHILTVMGLLGTVLAFLLRQRETGPNGHGLETIRAGK
ncbi:MAG: MFS transporter [Acidobacteriota bacterium]|nr:MFS transporter [Acidobacteriota bacterium]